MPVPCLIITSLGLELYKTSLTLARSGIVSLLFVYQHCSSLTLVTFDARLHIVWKTPTDSFVKVPSLPIVTVGLSPSLGLSTSIHIPLPSQVFDVLPHNNSTAWSKALAALVGEK